MHLHFKSSERCLNNYSKGSMALDLLVTNQVVVSLFCAYSARNLSIRSRYTFPRIQTLAYLTYQRPTLALTLA